MKGANIVPPGILRGDANVQAWLELVEAARAANMNMLRVWGGGVYPPDEFYEACDTAGILVWQDIMFANEMVPGSSGFTTSVEKEVKEVARRFRGHPSLALWCGNNEVEVAWQNWGWQDKYIISASDSVRMWNDYRRLFRKKIPEWLQVVDPNTPYISSSPISNWGNKDGLLSGDLHYWGVFHGDEGIGDFKHNIGRFVSEYGMQSYPSVEVLKSLTDSDSYKYTSSFWLSRQKSYKSDNPILDGLVRRFWTPSGPDEFVRLGRLYQADCYKEAIEQHRFAKEHCDGTLFWQLNDVWPGASWATVEQDGSWKPAHYAAKEAFKPDLLRFGHNQDSLWVELLSDHGVYGGSVHIRLFLSNGRKLWERTIPAGSPRVGGWKHQIFNAKAGVNRRILFAEWRDENGVVLADNHFIWVPPGRFWQEDPTFTVVRKQIGRAEYYFGVAVNKPVLYVHLNPSGFLPSEDYFALPPDREKTIPTRAVKSKSSDIFVVPMSLTPERKGRTGKPLLFSGLRTTELTE
jgi:beta-mannosidase